MIIKDRKNIFKKLLKTVAWVATVFLLMLVSIILLIRLPIVQDQLTQRAVRFLENKIGTKVRIERISISFPKKIVIQGIYAEDQSRDTLLFINSLSINTDLWALTKNRIQLNTIELTSSVVKVIRPPGNLTFNFDYIIQAFAPDTIASDTTQSSWKMLIGDIEIKEMSLRYDDRLVGNDLKAKIGSLTIKTDGFDPTTTNFIVSSIDWKNSRVDFNQRNIRQANSVELDAAITTPSNISFRNLNLKDITLRYSNNLNNQQLNATLGELEIGANTISLQNRLIDLNSIKFIDSFVSYTFRGETDTSKKPKPDTIAKSFSLSTLWNVKLTRLTCSNNSIHYYDYGKPVEQNQFDKNHVWLRGFTLDMENIFTTDKLIQASVKKLSVNDKNEFTIQSLSGEFTVKNTSVDIRNFNLKTKNSDLTLSTHASFLSIADFQHNFQRTEFELNVDKSVIGLKDILYFSPALTNSLPIRLPPDEKLSIDTKMTGRINDLLVSKLNLQTLNNTSIALRGAIKGLPTVSQTSMNVILDRFYTSAIDLKAILPDTLIPTSIQLPTWVELTGDLKGKIKEPHLNVLLISDFGKLNATAKVSLTGVPTYDVQLNSSAFDLGKILKQKELGKLDLKVSVIGSGLTIDSLDAIVDLHISKLEYNNYEYRDFKMNGTVKKYLFTGLAQLKDKNLDFEFKGDIDYQNDIPLYTFNFNLKNADFQRLHLSKRPLKARAAIDINLATSDLKVINGNLKIRNVAIYNGNALYKVDSLLFASIDQQGESEVSIRSDILTGDFKGTFNLFSLPQVFKQQINRYFSLQDRLVDTTVKPQNFKFDLIIKKTDLLTEIIFPELHSFVPGKISGEFDSEKNKLDIAIEISKLRYASTSVDSLTLNIDSDNKALRYKVRVKEFSIDTIRIAALQVSGVVSHDSVHTKLLIFDSDAKEKYVLGGVIQSALPNFRYHFIPDEVILNYKNWRVPVDNYLQFGRGGLVAHNLNLSSENEKISVVTIARDSSVSFQFLRWQLSNLTHLVEGVAPASGELNGDFTFTTSRSGEFNSMLEIKQLTLFEKKWGDASLSLTHTSNRYSIEMNVQGEKTKLRAKGFFMQAPSLSTFDIDVALSPFDLALIEPLSLNQLRNVNGSVEGRINLSGNLTTPSIRGSLAFKDASFVSTYLNTSFLLKNEKIFFEEKGIVLTNFKVTDLKNNEAIINGSILTERYKDFDFDLKVTSTNFQLLNTTIEDNSLYFGTTLVNTNAHITGNINEPKIDMTVGLGAGSKLTYVVPTAEKAALEQKGIVRFVDANRKNDPFLSTIIFEDTVQSLFRGIDVTATLDLTDKSVLNIVIDPATGDQLSLKGNSTLVFNSEASGNTNLSGRYEITTGTYSFSFYKLLKREFQIVKGSSITWSGDPLNAELDIQASYRVETSPLDLVYNQINISNQAEMRAYNQVLPFLVHLNMKGKLLAPQLSFALDMPDEKRNVLGGAIYAKLQDVNTRESDLNKQVFALLILQRFISDNPFESQSGSTSNTARGSVSRLLSEQLNRLSKNIKGVQLSFDLKSYQNNRGTEVRGETRAQLGVSKNLFNDRLVVKLSGNVDIEGQNTSRNSVTDYVGDLALEYKLTTDGRLRVTGFRSSNFDMIDGELIETGIGLIYIRDYTTLQELFRSNDKTK